MTVVGWTDSFNDACPTVSLTPERHQALVERVRKRKYNFSYQMLAFNPDSTPVYNDKSKCLLSKQQWDNVLNDAYQDEDLGSRLTPADILSFRADGILWEKKKFYDDMAGDSHE